MEYKYKYNISQIVDEMGDLKNLGVYYTNTVPTSGDQIVMVATNEDGTPIQRLYFSVRHILHYISVGDRGKFYQEQNILGDLQCELILDEGI